MDIDPVEVIVAFVRSDPGVIGIILPIVGGLAGWAAMTIAMRLILPPADVPAPWRYRTDAPELRITAPPASGGRAARRTAQWMLGIALGVPLAVGLFWVAEPGGPSPMFGGSYWYVVVLPWVGWIGYGIGLAWMTRIYRRSYLEVEQPTWRYRS